MVTAQKTVRIPRFWKSPRFALAAIPALVAVLALVIAFGTLIPPPNSAHAGGNEPWLYLECVEDGVDEGDEFRLQVRKKYKSHSPHKTMRVFWYTEAITADETDYEHMYAVRQASNGHQSESGKMGRTFHTLDDLYPETDETYLVRFNNSVDHGTDGECYITIKDDDGVGIYDLEIRSVPQELPSVEGGEGPQDAYTTGDVILIGAKFNHPVTTKNPETGEQTDYAGLYLQVGEHRRIANVVRGDGTDTLIFGYTVQPGDADLDGISVESGGPGTGLYYNEATRDGGLWPVNPYDGRLNRMFHGLADDPTHPVVQADVDSEIIDPPVEPPTDEDISIENPVPGEWAEKAVDIEPNLIAEVEGDLTEEDEGRDWFSFTATGGVEYIIELKSKMDIHISDVSPGLHTPYAEGFLIDPSILEIVNEDGEQVLGEHGKGGFLGNFARAFFSQDSDGTFYIAVGAGVELRSGLGLYTLSVRADDHADDHNTNPDIMLLPGQSITACIDSDVRPGDPGLRPWHWWGTKRESQPVYGLESIDDLDVFSFRIFDEGSYVLFVRDGPENVGIWHISDEIGNKVFHVEGTPEESVTHYLSPGDYRVAVGTPYLSSGNTGLYQLVIAHLPD